ncbi:MAG: TonB-dependent receptor [Vicinamibacterales bacterium]|nr:TonB-dependent receptor [Vicinamibacterales bacterium]
MHSRLAATVILILIVASVASAQTTADGSIRGYVKDEQGGVLPGVTLTAKSPTVGGVRSTVSDAAGFYRLLDLPPGEYAVTAELQGFARLVRESIVVRAGLNLGVDIVMKLGAMTETVEVRADTPITDTVGARQTVNISGDMAREVPLNTRRHWSSFLGLMPGVTGFQVSTRSADSFTLRGSDFASHVTQLDGADIGSAQLGATLYVHLGGDVIEDIEVKTGAVDASAPMGMGAVINMASKSGTNQLKGSAGLIVQRMKWNSTNLPGGTSAAMEQLFPELAVGGPIVRDRAWFFATYRHQDFRGGLSRTPAQIALLQALVPGYKPFDNRNWGHQLFVKASGQVLADHQWLFSYQYDPEKSTNSQADAGGQFATETRGGNLNFVGRVSSVWTPKFTTRLGVSFNNKANQQQRPMDVPSREVYSSAFLSGGRLTGSGRIAVLDNDNAGWSYDSPYHKTTFFGDATYYQSGWVGSHEFQSGVYLRFDHRESIQKMANGGFSREGRVLRDPANPAAGTIPFWREVFDVDRAVTTLGDDRDFAVYVQDAWKPTSRLTINAGVRLDYVYRLDRIFDMVTQDSWQVGPRFRATYALTKDVRNVIRASWGRVHDTITTNSLSPGTSVVGKQDQYDNNLDGTFETVFVRPGATAAAANRIIDTGRTQPFINETTVGYTRQFPGRLSVDASYIRREYRGRLSFYDVNVRYENEVFLGYYDPAFNNIDRVTNNTWNWHVYDGVDLQVSKQTASIQLLAGYTRAWRHMAGTWQPGDPASIIQPDAFANNQGLGNVRESGANSLSGSANTDNLSWTDHLVRLGAVYRGPWHLVLATNYSYQSGLYAGPVVKRITAADPKYGPPTLVLSNGRLVSNPLATTIRFAYPTRGEGQPRADNVHIWNVRVGRDLVFGARRLALAADVFNVVNAAADQWFESGGHQQYSTNYGKKAFRQLPRALQLSARFSF